MTTDQNKPRKRKPPLLADGREELFLPKWLVTGSYNLLRVDDKKQPPKPETK